MRNVQGSGEGTGRLEATGREVAEWLASGGGGLEPWRCCAAGAAAAEGGAPPEVVAAEVAADEAAAARVASAYAAVADFEATHHLNLQAMGASYLQERPEVASSLLAMAQALNLPVSPAASLAHSAPLTTNWRHHGAYGVTLLKPCYDLRPERSC